MKDMIFAACVILDKIFDSGIALQPHFDEYKDALRLIDEGERYEASVIFRRINERSLIMSIDRDPIYFYFSWAMGSIIFGDQDRAYRIANLAACANLLEHFHVEHPQGFAIVNNLLDSAPV